MTDFKIWEEVEPPKGAVYNYPVRPWHNAKYYIPGSSGAARYRGADLEPRVHPDGRAIDIGQSIKQSVAWAKNELEGFIR